MSALLPVQTGFYEKASADAALLALATGGVHDHVPQGTKKPYVVIGEKTEIPDNTLLDIGREDTVTLHIWSDAQGDKQALQILARLDDLFDNQPLAATGWEAWWVENEFVTTLREDTPGGVLRHVVARYRIKLQES